MSAAALLVGLLLCGSPPADADAPSSMPARSRAFELELDALEPIDPEVRGELARAIVASAAPVVASAPLPAAKIHVEVSWRDQDEVRYAVRIRFDAHDGRPALARVLASDPDATVAGLADLVVAGLERSVTEWSRPLARALPPVVEPPKLPPPVTQPATVDEEPPRRLGALGRAGVGVMILGVAGLGGGIGLLVLDRTVSPYDATRLWDWRYAGGALVGLGAAAIIAGAVMTGVDARRARPRRTKVSPWLSRQGGGAVLRVAF